MMDIHHARGLMHMYCRWLQQHTILEETGGRAVTVMIPVLDASNDYIVFYLEQHGDVYMVHDDGWTLQCCHHEIPGLDAIIKGLGITMRDGVIAVEATRETFPLRLTNYISALLHVHGAIMASRK